MNQEQMLFGVASLWASGLAVGVLSRKPRRLVVLSFAIGMLLLAADGVLELAILRAGSVDLLLQLGVREIRASINPTHAASIRVAERLGLRRTNELGDGELIWKRVYSTASNSECETG